MSRAREVLNKIAENGAEDHFGSGRRRPSTWSEVRDPMEQEHNRDHKDPSDPQNRRLRSMRQGPPHGGSGWEPHPERGMRLYPGARRPAASNVGRAASPLDALHRAVARGKTPDWDQIAPRRPQFNPPR